MISLMLICVAYILYVVRFMNFRNIEDSNMICNQNTEYFEVIVTIFYQNQMNLNMGLRTLPFCVMKVVCL